MRTIVLAADESPHSRVALDYAMQRIVHRPVSAKQLHLVTVLPPAVVPTSPVPMVGAMHAGGLLQAQQHQRQHDAQHAHSLLRALSEVLIMDYKVPAENVKCHVLPALGGASGVGESLVEAAKRLDADLLVVGTRGMGYIHSSLMSLIGLGSVSDYCLHKAPGPVLVVTHHHGKKPPVHISVEAAPLTPSLPTKKVLLCYDDSPDAHHALAWFLDKVASQHDQLHIVMVVTTPTLLGFADSPTAAAMEQVHVDREAQEAKVAAARALDKAVEAAQQHGVMRTRVVREVLNPEDAGSSEVGSALCQYAKDKAVDLVVIGSRGLGAWRYRLLGAVGLGSVSDYIVHHITVPLIVVKNGVGSTTQAQGKGSLSRDSPALLPRLSEEEVTAEEGAGHEEAPGQAGGGMSEADRGTRHVVQGAGSGVEGAGHGATLAGAGPAQPAGHTSEVQQVQQSA